MASHAIDAQAANWYVRPSGGTGSGTSWAAAWNGLSGISWASVSCGDTIWVAGGNYGDWTPSKVCSSSSVLKIRRARADALACSGAAGWNSGYDATIHQTGGINLFASNSYVTFSGRTTTNGGNHGWWIDMSGTTGGAGILFGHGYTQTYLTFEYFDVQGPGYITYTSDGRGIDMTPYSGGAHTGMTFSHMKLWNFESTIYDVDTTNSTYEYIDISDVAAVNSSAYHPNGFISWGSSGVTFRYSKFHMGNHHGTGEGLFCEQSGGCNNWKIYGNIFYNQIANGKNIQITSPVTNLKIWNNTFYNNTYSPVTFTNLGACTSGGEFRNNLVIKSGTGTCGTKSNNIEQTAPVPFVNSSGNDYHIVETVTSGYPRNAGANLSAYFTADMDGTTFGGDGTWDVGAYEYGSAVNELTAPSNLMIIPVAP